jgi:hypothetical protein
MDFKAYTDESYINANRFRSIACCSLAASSLEKVNEDINNILSESGVSEFKWKKLTSARYRLCAEKLISYTLKSIGSDNARIDVVIWDTHDSRHTIRNRDDDANFERMFFHLLSTSMRRRAKSAVWGLYPDEKNGIDWRTVSECLAAVGNRMPKEISIFARDFMADKHFYVKELLQVESHKHPLSQIADLYAGLSVFSRDKYEQYSKWCKKNHGQIDLFEMDEKEEYSNGDKERFSVLKHLDESCKSAKLGVSLKSKGYLNTPNPTNPLNFWSYEPQHDRDRAPTKNG